MAIYHFSGQILGRKAKQNPDGSWRPGSKAAAAAAYRSGSQVRDYRTGEIHDYRRRGGVAHTEIMVPVGAAAWLEDRELLWGTVERMEKRDDAQLAREFNMALPHELDAGQRLELVRDFVGTQFVRRGMVADLALHDPVAEQGQNARNYHAHVMLTLRRATAGGLDAVKTREWNSKELLSVWRAEWAVACNVALERAGKRQKVDHRTLLAQREDAIGRKDAAAALVLKREPEVHVGPKARQAERHSRKPQSRDRYVGAPRKPEAAMQSPARRRQRTYTRHDRGTRLERLREIIVGNNESLKRDLMAIDQRFDRLNRKLDYWERRIAFKSEGLIKGREFRFNRWKAAEAEKAKKAEAQRRTEHARKRLTQLRALLKILEGVATTGARHRERGLVRAREIEGWMHAVHRLFARKKTRNRGRGREWIF